MDCRVYTPENPISNFANIRSTIDVFVVAHLLGWIFKAIIFRNNLMAWTMSLAFETYEISLRHWLPNFYECWWDHLILDVFGCNMLGIIIGDYIIRKFNLPKFHWFFEPTERSENLPYRKRFWYSISEVRPYVEQQKWHFLASPTNFLIVLWLVALNSLTDLSNFFNKKMLGLPASHFLLAIRIWILGFYSIIVVMELYDFARQLDGHRKVSFNLYLSHFILLAEVVLFLRNFKGNLISRILHRRNTAIC
jgi:phosphatidylserine synthase 2